MDGSKTVNVEKKAKAKAAHSNSCSEAKKLRSTKVNHCFASNEPVNELCLLPSM